MNTLPDLQLPSLPEVTLRALEACHRDENYRAISEIVACDTALVVRILALANSSLYGPTTGIRSIDQALMRLGTRRFKTLILTAALRQILFELSGDAWQQLRDFWRHALTTAMTARALATLTRYPEADEAFMLGMLHNIGELIAINTPDLETRQQYMNRQSDIAAELVTSWGLGPLAADAMRYQQALPSELRDAGHLVKVISLASRLALSDSAGIAAAGTMFGLSEELTREINRRISDDVSTMAGSLGIPLINSYNAEPASQQLLQTVLQQAIAQQAIGFADLAGKSGAILAETVSSLTLITGLPALWFGYDNDNLVLLSSTSGQHPHLAVTAEPGGSMLTEAFNSHIPASLSGRTPTVLDRQLLSLLRTHSLTAVPVVTSDGCPGVFVLGTDGRTPDTIKELIRLFIRQLSSVLQEKNTAPENETEQAEINQKTAIEKLRRQVHEISNPLTIIRQYIHQLRNRLDDPDSRGELDVVREELDRAGNLLLQMSHDTVGDTSDKTSCLNAELQSLARLLEDSLFSASNLQFNVLTCRPPTFIAAGSSAIRQILINLTRNAAESLPDTGGTVTIKTSAPVWQGGRNWVEMEVSDTGTGVPETVRETLFTPGKTTKGEGHSGLGLSIVKQLVDDMEGIVACHTGQEGTIFRILLPAAS
ncbi:Histidine kinase-, DNA gyrase B-, and HSP90-like ATPase [Marinobacter sp. LV10R510-11A]|uniref:HDOD domain-containing protein n=1 Tax=Marinobacter sp. LV10R510-11A TaxID=1415568 RepID=UPI000BB869C0|nr:HDOD domain-containing protein [Marinobacter sp. LV10R510-11A]SOB76375.1 Histidine kinase-, DNA gyrase B-, and HSP90-like ATPase [Marinobacter sp. LV10R510-11A]